MRFHTDISKIEHFITRSAVLVTFEIKNMNFVISGNYCPRGTESEREYQCPPGTFSSKVGLISASQCDPCSPGKFCAGFGNVRPSGDCAAGITLNFLSNFIHYAFLCIFLFPSKQFLPINCVFKCGRIVEY